MDEEKAKEITEEIKAKAEKIAVEKAKEKDSKLVLPKGVEKPKPEPPPKAKKDEGYTTRPWKVKSATKKIDCYVCKSCGKALLSEDEMRLHVPQCK